MDIEELVIELILDGLFAEAVLFECSGISSD